MNELEVNYVKDKDILYMLLFYFLEGKYKHKSSYL